MNRSTLTLLALTLSGAATALTQGRAFVDVILHAFGTKADEEG